MPHDSGTGPHRAVQTAGTLRSDTVGVLDLAQYLAHLSISGIIKRTAFHEDRAANAVARTQIAQEVVESIVRRTRDGFDEWMARFWEGGQHRPQIPQVVMGVDDGQVRLEDRLAGPPILVSHYCRSKAAVICSSTASLIIGTA